MASKPMWMVRAGEDAQYIGDFKKRSMVAIGWGATGPLLRGTSREELTKCVNQAWPEYKKNKLANATGQIYRFINQIAVGDWVITYDPPRRVYLVGKVVGDPAYEKDGNPQLQHYREIAWGNEVSRDSLSPSSKNTLGAILTLFLLSDSARDETLKLAKGSVWDETG